MLPEVERIVAAGGTVKLFAAKSAEFVTAMDMSPFAAILFDIVTGPPVVTLSESSGEIPPTAPPKRVKPLDTSVAAVTIVTLDGLPGLPSSSRVEAKLTLPPAGSESVTLAPIVTVSP